jgi:viroplasmin and RNaseH domain-containing protein
MIFVRRLECHLNVSGVKGAVHKSFDLRSEAENAFEDQLVKGRTQAIVRSEPMESFKEGA